MRFSCCDDPHGFYCSIFPVDFVAAHLFSFLLPTFEKGKAINEIISVALLNLVVTI
ncbi:Uncharacterized protein APZ42_022493 [Daphnia magna]|uniref:Uncharacterized protein n=1 Tax=Daphnia magna TaxID=35525 RepID=A0A164VJI8_9CRUS|nr:Uncharacterized protein APZ42_022493 [Daphnia magna]